jgi:hypothetical protein
MILYLFADIIIQQHLIKHDYLTGEAVMHTEAQLEEKLQRLEKQIAETRRRLPAHSVKPPIMMELLALEDEYESILGEIADLSKKRDIAGE